MLGDVYEVEPRTPSPLFDLERVVLTPHIGGSSVESSTASRIWAVENLIALFGGAPRNVVNPEALASDRTRPDC